MSVIVTLTGTGTPRPAPNRAGAGVLLQNGQESLQIDVGRGTTMRLSEAGVQCHELDALFLTHHHSDHVIGLPDLLISRWVMGATESLPVIAPDGPLTAFGEHVLDLWADDIQIRSEHTGRLPAPKPDWQAFRAEREPRQVWQGKTMAVSTVLVRHEPVYPAVAYRVDAGGRSVVISGDTRVCDEVENLSRGVDLLIHEAVRPALLGESRSYVAEYHADAMALGEMAQRAGAARLALTHLEPAPTTPGEANGFEQDVRRGGFTGEVLVGTDLAQIVLD